MNLRKIAVIGMTNNPGGVETYLMNFFSAMNENYKIIFININPDSGIAYQDDILSRGGEIFSADNEYSLKSYFNRTGVAKRILERVNADIVYINALTTNSAYWVSAARDLDIPAVYHSHNASEVFSSRLKRMISNTLKPRNQRILKSATCLSASYESGKFMFNNAKSTVIYNSIDPIKWKFNTKSRLKIRDDLGIDTHKKLIIMVSRLSKQKNVVRAVRILKSIIEQDDSYRCIVVGDGDLKEQVVEEINDLNLEKYVKLLGRRNDVPELMFGSDMLLLPSLFEGLPFVVIEAQGAGLPVVASEGVVPDVANVTKEIFKISLEQSNKVWAEKILKVELNDISKRLEMNREINESAFSLSFYNQKIKSIFDNL